MPHCHRRFLLVYKPGGVVERANEGKMSPKSFLPPWEVKKALPVIDSRIRHNSAALLRVSLGVALHPTFFLPVSRLSQFTNGLSLR